MFQYECTVELLNIFPRAETSFLATRTIAPIFITPMNPYRFLDRTGFEKMYKYVIQIEKLSVKNVYFILSQGITVKLERERERNVYVEF